MKNTTTKTSTPPKMKYAAPTVQTVSVSSYATFALMCGGRCGNGSNARVF